MKLVYDHKIFWIQRYGGISRYFINLFKNFNHFDIDYKIVSPFFKNNYLNEEIEKKKIIGRYIKKPFPKTSFLINAYNNFYFNHSLKKIKPDLIHTTYYNNSINKNKTPLVTTVYDLIHERNSVDNGKYNLFKKKALEISDHLICISNKTQKDLIDIYNISKKKISVIHLGSDHLEEKKEFSEVKIEKPFLIFIGSRKKYKNFTTLLRCISFSEKLKKNFDLVVFGGEQITPHEKKMINNFKLAPMNIYFENGDDQKLKYFLKQSTCFIFPSLDEGFGLPILESMRSHCPVFCSDIEIFKEVAADCAEYFDPSDVENMKSKLEDVLFSPSKLENLKKLGYERSLDFTWRDCTSKTFDIYRKLVD